MRGLLREERHQQILDIARKQSRVIPIELSRTLGVSEITIRRDIQELAAKGFLKRAHGGAILAKPAIEEPPILHRMLQNSEYKDAIGRATAKLIKDGDSIFLSSGSTTAYVARHLVNRKKLTVVTNALNIGTELATAEDLTVVVVGGMLRPSELSLVGHIAELSLKEIRVEKVLIGIPAISLEHGLTNDYLPEVLTDRAILNMASKLILVADHTKFNKVASAYVSPLERVTTLVTDKLTDPFMLDKIRQLGIEVILADGEEG